MRQPEPFFLPFPFWYPFNDIIVSSSSLRLGSLNYSFFVLFPEDYFKIYF